MPLVSLAADDIKSLLDKAAGAQGAGYDTAVGDQTGLARVAGSIVRVFLSLLGILFISYTIYGGFLWMTAAGNEESVKKAKVVISNGAIGLVVILSAAAIYYFITAFLITGSAPAI